MRGVQKETGESPRKGEEEELHQTSHVARRRTDVCDDRASWRHVGRRPHALVHLGQRLEDPLLRDGWGHKEPVLTTVDVT